MDPCGFFCVFGGGLSPPEGPVALVVLFIDMVYSLTLNV